MTSCRAVASVGVGGTFAHHITTCPSRFSDLATALSWNSTTIILWRLGNHVKNTVFLPPVHASLPWMPRTNQTGNYFDPATLLQVLKSKKQICIQVNLQYILGYRYVICGIGWKPFWGSIRESSKLQIPFPSKNSFIFWIGSHCGEFVFGIALFYAPAFSWKIY